MIIKITTLEGENFHIIEKQIYIVKIRSAYTILLCSSWSSFWIAWIRLSSYCWANLEVDINTVFIEVSFSVNVAEFVCRDFVNEIVLYVVKALHIFILLSNLKKTKGGPF